MNATVYLFLAIFFEVAGTTSMKLSEGFTKLMPSVAMVIFYLFAFAFLTFAIKKIDVSLAYAIWSGLGTLLIAIIGIGYFHEPVSVSKVISLGLIIVGVIGLRVC